MILEDIKTYCFVCNTYISDRCEHKSHHFALIKVPGELRTYFEYEYIRKRKP